MSFWSKLGSSIGSAIFNNNIGSGLMSFFGFENAADERLAEQQYNSMEADKNREFQRMMWQANNAYNSPENQLKRLMRAGINPNAMFGVSNPSVASSAPSGAQAAPTPSIANSLLLHDAQIANLMAQTRNIDSQTNLNAQEYSYNAVTFNDRVDSLKYANKETKERIDSIISDRDIQQKTFEIMSRKSEEELKMMVEQVNKIRAEVVSINKNTELVESQIEGQDTQNALERLKLQFSQASGVPHGTPVEEALWKTVVNGDFGTLVDTLIQNVEDVSKRNFEHLKDNVENFSRKTFGDKATNRIIDEYKELKKLGRTYIHSAVNALPFFNP